MNVPLLEKIFGRDQRWQGPCTVIVNAEAALYALGQDSIVGGGAKQYAPRMISGRILRQPRRTTGPFDYSNGPEHCQTRKSP